MPRLLGNGSINNEYTHATIEELSDASFSMQSVSYQASKEDDSFFSELLRAASEVRVGYADVMG
jgi:hypothetical protein